MGFRKVPDRYTPFFDSLGDKESRESHKRDLDDYHSPQNNSFQAKQRFVGTVMTPMTTQAISAGPANAEGKVNEAFLLVEGLTDGGLPFPSDVEALGTNDDDKAKLYNYILTCYPKGQSKPLAGDMVNVNLNPGDNVFCEYDEGPAFLGRQRGLKFDGTRASRNPGFIKEGSVGQPLVGLTSPNAGGAGGQLGSYIAQPGIPAETGVANTPMTSTDSTFAKPAMHAANFGKSGKRPGSIKYILLHSTDGSKGPGTGTLSRFARGPTVSFRWKHPTTGKTIKNPLVSEYMKFNTKLPEKGIVRKRGYTGTMQDHIEKKVSTSIHYAVDGLADGNIFQGLAEKDVAYHSPKYNWTSIGIEMCGKPNKNPGKGVKPTYSEMYNEIMVNNCARLCADICKRLGLPPTRQTIIGHEDDQANRSDPGESRGNFDYTDFLARVSNYMRQMG